MRVKPALAYSFGNPQVVYEAIRRAFTAKQLERLPDWEAIVECACFPNVLHEQSVCLGYESEQNREGEWVHKLDAKTGKAVKAFSRVEIYDETRRVFLESFARDPDLASEVFQLARQTLATLEKEYSGNDISGKARDFLLKHQTLVRENGALRLPQTSDAKSKKRIVFVSVDSPDIQDGELAAFIFGSQCPEKYVGLVKKARESISFKIKRIKGRRLVLMPKWPAKGKIS